MNVRVCMAKTASWITPPAPGATIVAPRGWPPPTDPSTLRGPAISFTNPSVRPAVNQAGVLLNGEQTPLTWVRIGFNHLIPYVVASLGYLAPYRREQE